MREAKEINVLLVDDETEFAETLAERLRLRAFNVTVASRAEEALAVLDSGTRPDVILLDLKMPGLDGLDALGEIRSRYPEVATIMLTGHGATETSMEGMRKGAFDYLLKPVDIGDLTAKIEQAAGKKTGGRQ
ncbi:MAG: response regulator [Thermoleophilia bacterium]|nr:response regulator [Thermoleophilia bacterium]